MDYPTAEKVVLVCDNLNTHTAALSIGSRNNSGEKKFTQINTGQNCKYLKLGEMQFFQIHFRDDAGIFVIYCPD